MHEGGPKEDPGGPKMGPRDQKKAAPPRSLSRGFNAQEKSSQSLDWQPTIPPRVSRHPTGAPKRAPSPRSFQDEPRFVRR